MVMGGNGNRNSDHSTGNVSSSYTVVEVNGKYDKNKNDENNTADTRLDDKNKKNNHKSSLSNTKK